MSQDAPKPLSEQLAKFKALITSRAHEGSFLEAVRAGLADAGFRIMPVLEMMPDLVVPADYDGELIEFIVCDTETTGLDPVVDEIIQLSMLKIQASPEGEILGFGDFFDQYREPTQAVFTPEAQAVTGLTPEFLKGKAIDPQEVKDFVGDCGNVICHNAAFDRKFLEKHFADIFCDMNFHCSVMQVDWKKRGSGSANLETVALKSGFVINEAHNSRSDTYGLAHVLASSQDGERSAFAEMLEKSGRSLQVIAENTPYSAVADLKAAGFRWDPDGSETAGMKSWHKSIPITEEAIRETSGFLSGVFGRNVSINALITDSKIRYSSRKPEERSAFHVGNPEMTMEQMGLIQRPASQPRSLMDIMQP